MFKWVCLSVAVVAVVVLGWMINDLRLEARKSVHTINEHLPVIVEKTRRTADVVNDKLPGILSRAETTGTTLAELAHDVQMLKQLAGVDSKARDQGLVAYADSVLDLLEKQPGQIGLRKKLGGSGLKDTVPVKEWVVAARREALLLTVLVKSRRELLERLTRNKFGSDWYLELPGQTPVRLSDWIKANHPASKEL